MTALQLPDIPVDIETVEELLLWVGELYYFLHPGSEPLTNNEGIRINYPYAQKFQFEADSRVQFVRFDLIVPLKVDSGSKARFPWKHASQLDLNSPLPFPPQYAESTINPT